MYDKPGSLETFLGFRIIHNLQHCNTKSEFESTLTAEHCYRRLLDRCRIKTVSKAHSFERWDLPLSEEQTPHIVEKPKNRRDAVEPKEARCRPYKQEVRGSSPRPPTIPCGAQPPKSSNEAQRIIH